MNNIITEKLANIEFLKPQTHNNMSIIGFKTKNNNKIDFLTLNKGLNMGLVEIDEINEEGSVPELKVKNDAITPLLLLDGEELTGAKQNRILNTTILIPEKSEITVPVSCTEAGRWDFTSKHFQDSGHIASATVRKGKTSSVSESLKTNKLYQSNQSKVWNDIANAERTLKVKTETGALRDIYTAQKENVDNYLKDFKYIKNQNGSLIFINGEIIGMELIYNTYRYQEYHEKIIKSYILDAIQHIPLNTPKLDDTKLLDSALNFINLTLNTKAKSYPSIGYGEDIRIENENIFGSALTYQKELIHTVLFKKLKA